MYAPFASALNHALQCPADIRVDSLPDFNPEEPIAFMPLNRQLTSKRDLTGFLFKPDVGLVTFRTACRQYGIDDPHLDLAHYAHRIRQMSPYSTLGWSEILSAVEIKRGWNSQWPDLKNFAGRAEPAIVTGVLDNRLDASRGEGPSVTAVPLGGLESTTREIYALALRLPTEVISQLFYPYPGRRVKSGPSVIRPNEWTIRDRRKI